MAAPTRPIDETVKNEDSHRSGASPQPGEAATAAQAADSPLAAVPPDETERDNSIHLPVGDITLPNPDPVPGGASTIDPTSDAESISLGGRIRRILIGPPRSLYDPSLFHKVSLIAILAWVGLGADGLSSSSYGPEEAFRTLGNETYLAVILAMMTMITVLVISAGYTRIIEQFPHGGGGYVVSTKLLGEKIGLISGCALLVDYVLTVAVSIAAAGDALFSFVPPELAHYKVPFEVVLILGLTTLNIRGVKESIIALTPIFFIFVVTHIIVIIGGIIVKVPHIPETASQVAGGFDQGLGTLGVGGILLLVIHAFSMGGGTYTGIEAVSNGIPMMRPPQVETAKRTMVYMAVSLSFTATGLLLCYLLWNTMPVAGKTMNAVLVTSMAGNSPLGYTFALVTLLSEGALLVVGAQTGFADGPRILANLAMDSWVPRRFAALSERLTTANGIVLMGGAALAALLYNQGDVRHLVVMYSINVFLTFSLSLLGMGLHSYRTRARRKNWKRRVLLFATGVATCATILIITTIEKFSEGGWVTLAVTGSLIILCLLIRRHYDTITKVLRTAFSKFEQLGAESSPILGKTAAGVGAETDAREDEKELENLEKSATVAPPSVDPEQPAAAIFVTSYGGLGIHTTLNAFRAFPDHFRTLIFISVGVIDSGGFKGEDSIEQLTRRTEEMLQKYVRLAHRLGLPATCRMAIGTDTVDEAEKVSHEIAHEFPHVTFIAGQLLFQKETWYQKILHNQTAYSIQRRLQWAGYNMMILPARVY